MMKVLLAAALAAFAAAPAAADWAPGHSDAAIGWRPGHDSREWHPDTAFPSTPPIQRYGKGRKGMMRFGRGLSRDAEFRRFQQDSIAFLPAAVRMEDSRGKCDRRLKAALDSGDQAELEAARDYCKPKAYGPQLR